MQKKNFTQKILILFTKKFRLYFISYFLIFGGFTLVFLSFGSTIYSEYHYYLDKTLRTKYIVTNKSSLQKTADSNFLKNLILGQTIRLTPPSPNSIIIEKIGVSAPIILNVSVTNEDEYFDALKKGVALAKGKALPGQVGNVYLFAHSSIEFWKMGPYATVFNQIRRLENGDIIYLFYNGQPFKYVVFDKYIVEGFDLKPYTQEYLESVVTLQTCDPPGTQLNRLIVTAKLVND